MEEELYYMVNELKVEKGVPTSLSDLFSDPDMTSEQRKDAALAKYHQILSAAYASGFDFHGAYFMSSDGNEYRSESVSHKSK